jgi:hypothetical protein
MAVIHDLTADRQLDFSALQETRFSSDTLVFFLRDMATPGYSAMNLPRLLTPAVRREVEA